MEIDARYLLSLSALLILILAMFYRFESRMTRTETLLKIIAKRVGLCQQSSDKDSG